MRNIPSFLKYPLVALSAVLAITGALALILGASSAHAATGDVLYPSDAGVINVKTAYGAKGDGHTDDTQAILNAIRANVGQFRFGVLYFPAGTYVVSKRLDYLDNNGNWGAYLTLQGQNPQSTTIKLADHCAGFGDATNPQAVIYTASNRGSPYYGNASYPNAASPLNVDGSGNEGFRNHIMNLSVNTGVGNPGAIGIDYMANNNTRISDVTIASGDGAGVFGLSIQRGNPGPMFIKNLTVTGFSTAISATDVYGVWVEHLSLNGQSVSGVDVNNGSVSIRDLESADAVPAVRVPNWTGALSLVDSTLSAGSPAVSAVQVGPSTGGTTPNVFLRNITSSGYASAVSQSGAVIPGASQAEWTSLRPLHISPVAALKSLDLPISETPTYNDTNFANWANVETYGAKPNFPTVNLSTYDSRAAIQAAIDSGHSTVYLPPGDYLISDTIHVRGAVTRILFLNAYLIPLNTQFPTGHPAIQIDSNQPETVTVENLGLSANWWIPGPSGYQVQGFPAPNFVNASSSTVVLLNADDIGYQNQPPTTGAPGTMFIESVLSGWGFVFQNQVAYARNLDPENFSASPHVHVQGGTLWTLGLKIEGPTSPILAVDSGGTTEVLGAVGTVFVDIPASVPAFVNTESTLSVASFHTPPFAETGGASDYDVNFQETIQGITRTLARSGIGREPAAYPYAPGSSVPLYVGNPSAPAPLIANQGIENAAGNGYTGLLAPGEVASIYGTNLATGTQNGGSPPYRTSLQGTTVSVNGVVAPLLYVSPGQINFQVPTTLALGAGQVEVDSPAGESNPLPMTLSQTAPALYTSGGAPILQQSAAPFGAVGTATHPIAVDPKNGAYITLYGSGFGLTNPAVPAGALASSISSCAATLTATLDGATSVPVLFCGLNTQYTGEYQLNLQIPASVAAGTHTLTLAIGGQTITVSSVVTSN